MWAILKKITLCLLVYGAQPVKAQLQLILPLSHKIIEDFYENSDGSFLITKSTYEVKVWEVNSARLLYTLPGTYTDDHDMDMNGMLVTIVVDQGIINIRNIMTGEILLTLGPRAFYANSAVLSHDGKYVVSTSDDNKVRIWNSATGAVVHVFNTSLNPVKAYFSPDDRSILVGTSSELRIWNIDSQKFTDSVKLTNNGGWFNLSFCDNGHRILARTFSKPADFSIPGSGGSYLYIYDLDSHQLNTTLTDDQVYGGFALSADGNRLAKCRDNEIFIWDLPSMKLIYQRRLPFSQNNIALDPTGSNLLIAAGRKEKKLRSYNISDSALNKSYQIPGFGPYGSSYHYSNSVGKFLVAPIGLQKIYTTSSSTGQIINSFQGQSSSIDAIYPTSDPDLLLTQSFDRCIRVWDLRNARIQQTYPLHNSTFVPFTDRLAVDYESDGDHPERDSLILFAPLTGKTIRKIASSCYPVALSSDNQFLITSNFYQYQIHDLKTDKEVTIDPNQYGLTPFTRYFYIPEKQLFICTDQLSFQVSVWDALSGHLVYKTEDKQEVSIETDSKPAIAWSSSRRCIAIGGYDGSLTIIDFSGHIIAKRNLTGAITALCFDPLGKFLIAGQAEKLCVIPTATWLPSQPVATNHREIYKFIFHKNGTELISAYEDDHYGIWPFPSMTNQHTFAISGSVAMVDTDHDRLLASIESMVSVYDLRSGEKRCDFAALLQSDYIFKLPDNHYLTSPFAARYLGWMSNGKRYDFDQWDVIYNRPDKVLAALGSTNGEAIRSYQTAYQARLKVLGIDSAKLHPEVSPPTCTLLNNKALKGIKKDSVLDLAFHLTGKTSPLSRLFLTINSVPYFPSPGLYLKTSHDTALSVRILLGPGQNVIKAYCTDAVGLHSEQQSAYISYAPDVAVKSNVYFIGIGANAYALDAGKKLSYPDKDIRDVTATLQSRYPNLLIDTFTNSRVTPAIITELRKFLSRVKINDKVIFLYCGHGIPNADRQFFCATYLTDFKKPDNASLPYTQIEALLTDLPSRQKLLMLDACNSGFMASKVGRSNEDIFRHSIDQFYVMQDLFANLSAINGVTVICAARGDQAAGEGGTLQNGWFTHALLEALKTKNAYGYVPILISQFQDNVYQQVKTISNNQEIPTSRNQTYDFDWEL